MMSLPFIILHHDKTNPRIDIILISDVAPLWLSQELYSNLLCHAIWSMDEIFSVQGGSYVIYYLYWITV